MANTAGLQPGAKGQVASSTATQTHVWITAHFVCSRISVHSPLERLYKHMKLRFTDFDGNPKSIELDDMPPLDEVFAQFKILAERLRVASSQAPFSLRWRGQSGTVIAADVFTQSHFYTGCKDYLYLWKIFATKTMNEAVVEGMGGKWDRAAADDRHPSFESGIEEAVVAYSAPQPYHAEADLFCHKALNHHFKGGDWNFHHVDKRFSRVRAWAETGGKVIGKHKQEPLRLPSSFY